MTRISHTRDGEPEVVYGRFTDHEVRFPAGERTIDTDAETAAWAVETFTDVVYATDADDGICGAPTADETPCQRPVAGGRCHQHAED